MKTFFKLIISVTILLIGFLIMGYPMPYFFGRVLVRIGLFGASIMAVYKIWKTSKSDIDNSKENQ